ncbi:MAG: hypothetical protein R3F59_01770 [Myxococcota bacterium]
MDPECAAVRTALATGGALDRRHIAECEACSALLDVELGGSIAEPVAEDDPVVQAVLAKVKGDSPPPLARLPSWVRHAVVWGAVGGSAAIAWAFGAGPRTPWDPLGEALAAALGAPVALRPVHRPRLRAEVVLVGLALLLPALVGLLPPVVGPIAPAEAAAGWGCFARGLLVGGLVLGLVAVSDRRKTRPLTLWLAAAAVAGGAGALALAVWCPAGGTVHRVVDHGAIGLVLAAIVTAARWARRA